MSAILNFNRAPLISWKGKSFQEITASIKKNTNTTDEILASSRAQPMKHYRKELISAYTANIPNQRISISLNNINTPGSTIVNSSVCSSSLNDCVGGIALTKNFNLTENLTERPCYPNSTENINTDDTGFSQASIARRRVRSSGIISNKSRPGTTNDMYKTSNAQYLESRGLTFKQNQYNYVKEGDKTAIPGDVLSMSNIYVGNNMTNCPKLLISSAKNNNYFEYIWIDGITYTITFYDDYYSSEELTIFIQTKMKSNGHYYTKTDGSILYLIQMYYNSYYKRYDIISLVTNTIIHSNYTAASGTITTTSLVCNIIIPDTNFQKVVGITSGSYPPISVTTQLITPTYSSNQSYYGLNPTIRPSYKAIYYKPNNINYSQQGAVSSSDKILRKKVDTITTSASSFRSAFGAATASSVAYGVSNINNLKLKTGYSNTKIPIINKYTDELSCNDRQCMIRR